MSYTIFHIWDIREMFEEVAHFVLIYLIDLKHIEILPWYNNENQVPIIHGFHIHFSDFDKNIFGRLYLNVFVL